MQQIHKFFFFIKDQIKYKTNKKMMRSSSYQQFLVMPQENLKVFDKNAIDSLDFIQSKPNGSYLFYDPNHNIRLQMFVVKIKPSKRREILAIYEWRSGTGFPFVKTFYVETVRKTANQQVLHVFNQLCQVRLSQLVDVPFNQILYVLKQSLIGFDHLFAHLGIFLISSSMISINQKGKCRVWINQQFQLNSCIPNNVSQAQSLRRLLKIFQQKVAKSKLSINFFQNLKYEQNVVDMLAYINKFIKENKINVPNRFSLASFSTIKNTVKRFNSHTNLNLQNQLQKHRSLNKICSFKKISYINQQSPSKPSHVSNINKKLGTISALINKNKIIEEPSQSFNPTSTLKLQIKPNCSGKVPSCILKNQKTSRRTQQKPTYLNTKQGDKWRQNMQRSFQINQNAETPNYFKHNKKQKCNFHLTSMAFQQKIECSPNDSAIQKDQYDKQQDQVEPLNKADICTKNGWSMKIDGILKSKQALKKSYSIGGENITLNDKHEFKTLKPGQIYQSIVSEDF